MVIAYKAALLGRYAVTSANSMLASLNAFFRFAGRVELCVRQFKVQRQMYLPEDKLLTRKEYERLVHAAESRPRLQLILQTICATGIRVSELRYFTVEAVRRGEIAVSCKGKNRRILLLGKLRKLLLSYAKEKKITTGVIFRNSKSKPLDRSSIWRQMKQLCKAAGVQESKVFPHNLRKLFARTFYGIEKDIAKLADILGHSSINTTRI